ncbi:tetratricopeptide repeat protein [Gaetbulibacter sp. M240]|uniref:tetratricopeptide repeat protein n=1 Tax=Gaetbulibacter sp. M240 TaxID=3126511 RepID=UPI00374F3722
MIKKRKKKWKKRLLIFFSSLIILIIVLGIVFNQFVYMLIFHFGYSQVYNGNNERGNKIMEYAISKLKSPNAKIYHALSVQNTKNGNYDIAISSLEKSYRMNPNEAGAYYGWVLLYYYHDYEMALEVLNRYDDSTPRFSDWPMGECIHYLKGLAHKELGDFKLAIQEFNISIGNTSKKHGEDWVDYQVFLNKGISFFYLEEYDKAIIEFDRVIKNYDKCSEAYYFKGLSQLKLLNSNLGCSNLNKALSLISQGYKSSDTYVELFHEIYVQQVEQSILENCYN